jgi:hypothetical protein
MVVVTLMYLELNGPSPSLPGVPRPLCPRAVGCTGDKLPVPRRPGSLEAVYGPPLCREVGYSLLSRVFAHGWVGF